MGKQRKYIFFGVPLLLVVWSKIYMVNKSLSYFLFSCLLITPIINICSASQPSFLAKVDPKRSAKHFLPKRELPPYPEPKLMISLLCGLWDIRVFGGLHGQTTSFWPFSKGQPTEWRHLINCPSPFSMHSETKLLLTIKEFSIYKLFIRLNRYVFTILAGIAWLLSK